MDWTRLLSLAMVVLVALLVVGSFVELGRTTLADVNYAVVSGIALSLVVVVVAAVTVAGARSRQWLSNPDSYW